MPDMGSISAIAASINAAVNITKAMKDLRDLALVQSKVIELQGVILEAQSGLFTANEERASLIEEIREAESKIAQLETWNAEKQRYQLTDIGDGNFAYALRQSMSSGEPPHYICTACYQNSKKSILHHFETGSGLHVVTCPGCSAKMSIDRDYIAPSYLQNEEDKARARLQRCPICNDGRLKVTAIKAHPQLGPVGVQEMSLKCDRCDHSEKRNHDPNKAR